MRSDSLEVPPAQVARISSQMAATEIALSLGNGVIGSVVLLMVRAMWHRAAVIVMWLFIGIAAWLGLYTFVRAVAPFPLILGGKLLGKVETSWSALGWYTLGMLARIAAIAVDVGIA